MIRTITLIACLAPFSTMADGVADDCDPNDVNAGAGWKLVELEDLPSDDQSLWLTHHAGEAPGVTRAHLGNGTYYCAFTYIDRSGDKTWQKLLLREVGRGTVEQLVAPIEVPTPFVVWRASPGSFLDRESGGVVSLQYDSIVFEKIESVSRQFYLRNGSIHELLGRE